MYRSSFFPFFRTLLIAAVMLFEHLAAAIDTGFDPNANGNIYAVLIQPDGKILIGGSFTSLQPSRDHPPVVSQRLARLNPDGSLDDSFAPALDGDVTALALQPDGAVVVAGKFTHAQTDSLAPAYTRRGLARFGPDGTLDLAFDPNPSGAPPSQALVYALAVQPDGRLLIGGGFTSLQPHGLGDAIARSRLARLERDGSVDLTFDPRANNIVYALALQRDGRIILGGGFTSLQPNGAAETISRHRIARLNTDGTVDPGFDPHANNRVLAIAVEPNDTILIGGDFTSLHPPDHENPATRSHLARLHRDGRILDGDFDPRPNAAVSTIALQRDGMILVAGAFSTFHPSETGTTVSARYLARLTRLGAVDLTFNPSPNAAVSAIALHDDGRIVLGGYFSRLHPPGASLSILRNRIARIQPDGALDTAFATDADGRVTVVASQPDGGLVIGGLFNTIAGVTRHNLARVRADGSLDPFFHPQLDGQVRALAVQPDGRIIAGGDFITIDDFSTHSYLVRFNADGSIDETFDPKPNSSVNTILLENDGLLLGGNFSSFRPNGATDSTTRTYLARLNPDGTLHAWDAAVSGAVHALARQPDGRLVVGGSFSSIASAARNNVARLNLDGSVDATFDPNPNGTVRILALQSDGKVVFGGDFTLLQLDDQQADDDDEDLKTDDDADRAYLARLHPDGKLDLGYNPTPGSAPDSFVVLPDGRLLIAGGFTYFQPGGAGKEAFHRRYLACLNDDGSVDASFNLETNERAVFVSPLHDGHLFIAGHFTSVYSGTTGSLAADNHLVRLNADATLDSGWQLAGPHGFGGHVAAVAFQADGRILVGGDFERLAGGTTMHLARLTADGSPDLSFGTNPDGPVRALLMQPASSSDTFRGNLFAWLEAGGGFRTSFSLAETGQLSGQINAIAVQPDGAILLGGFFTNRAGTTSGGLARFHPDGTLDPSFNPAPDLAVSSLELQPDGKILVAGAFTAIGGQARSRIARLNPDGSLDESFNPAAPSANINALSLQADGRIVIGGAFTTFDVDDGENDDDDFDGLTNDDTTRRYLARLNADGTLDNSYRPEPNGSVTVLLRRPDGKLLVGGQFSSLQPNGASDVTTRSYIALLNEDGTLDAFDIGLGGEVTALALQPDGRLLIGGAFALVQLDDREGDDDDGDEIFDDDADRYYLIRLNADHSLDAAFEPTPNAQVNAIAVQPDGRIVLGGPFTALQPNDAELATTRNHLARLHADGTLDTSFNPNADNVVQVIVARDDGSLLVGGAFTSLRPDSPVFVAGDFQHLNGVVVPHLARLNLDGNPDTDFLPAPDAPVHALAVPPDGGLVAAGAFTQIYGNVRERLARFAADGELDPGFAPRIDGTVTALALQRDGAIVIGGDFTAVNGSARTRLARLLPDGSLDAGFAPAANGSIAAIALQPDGQLLIAGEFTTVTGVERARLVRLRTDGSLDPSFQPAPDGAVTSIALQADGGIVVGGDFTHIAGALRTRVARLNPDGSLDPRLDDSPAARVLTVALTKDGRVLAGGEFTRVNGVPRYLISRLDGHQPALEEMAVNDARTAIGWRRSGSAAALYTVTFAVSTDRVTWTTLGSGTRTAGGVWQWSGESAAPAHTLYYIRARGVVPTSQGGSSSVVETIWQFFNSQPAGTGYPADFSPLAFTGSSFEPASGNPASGASDISAVTDGGNGGPGENPDLLPSSELAGARFANLSSLVDLAGDARYITGFVVNGTAARRVLLRAVGPGLRAFAIEAPLVAPYLELYDASGQLVQEAAAWGGDPAMSAVFTSVGAFPLPTDSADAAIAPTLAPGAYTLHVRDRDGGGGTVLAEIYDAGGAGPESGGLSNLSTRGTRLPDTAPLVAGFVIAGGTTQRVLVRALGPALVQHGVTDALSDPLLRLHDGSGRLLAENDNWQASSTAAADLAATAAATGAAPLETGSRDAAAIVTLPPGAYTITGEAADAASGTAVLEIYAAP